MAILIIIYVFSKINAIHFTNQQLSHILRKTIVIVHIFDYLFQ